MNATAPTDPIAAFERNLLDDIPMARAMRLRVGDYDGQHLVIRAPLEPNANDKGCAFGGSLVSLLTLAGWGLIVMHLREIGRECEVYVQDSNVRYLAPVWSDFEAHAKLDNGESWQDMRAMLEARGRGRIRVACEVPGEDGKPACTLQARFVAIAKR